MLYDCNGLFDIRASECAHKVTWSSRKPPELGTGKDPEILDRRAPNNKYTEKYHIVKRYISVISVD